MNYQKYFPVDVINGPGTRCTLFVSGCEHRCRGCYNATTWKPESGHPFTAEMEDQLIHDLNDTRILRRGLSLSGGDPLHPANLDGVLQLIRRVQAETCSKDIYLWTGYTLDQLSPRQQQVVDLVNTVIDGRFEQELADPSLKWRGSSNQIIHNLR